MTQEERDFQRSPLHTREQLLGSDVEDAIDRIVEADKEEGGGLPLAITVDTLFDTLMVIVEEGGSLPKIARPGVETYFRESLTKSSVLQAGYKRYEKEKKRPVVPVTHYFFKRVYGDGSVRGYLDGMGELEITQSLPKRPSQPRKENGEYDPDLVVSGHIHGIIVFPTGSKAELLKVWLQRRANATVGLLTSTVNVLGYAVGDNASMRQLQEHAAPIPKSMQRALPKPRS